MSTTIITQQGDILDALCSQHYGYVVGAMEPVLETTPWLTEFAGWLPAGLVIQLPELQTSPQKDIVRIWSLACPLRLISL